MDSASSEKIRYNDYGETSTIKQGHGYNGEMLDRTGLIYLRARYYDPSIARFIQIDKNYEGEKQQVSSQNKYVYTLSNPYKYVDRDGNKSISVVQDNLIIGLKTYRQMSDKVFNQWVNKQPSTKRLWYITDRMMSKSVSIVQNAIKTVVTGSNKASNKAVGSSSKAPAKKVKKPKCENKKSAVDGFLDSIQTILDYVGWIPFTIGDIADGLNALIYFLRGNVLMAAINIVCMALPNAVMAGAKAIGKKCKDAVEFISKLSSKARGMVKTVTSFITGIRDAIGKVIWLVGEKTIRPIMDKLDDFAKKIKGVFSEAEEKVVKEGASGNKGTSGDGIPSDTKYSPINPCDKISREVAESFRGATFTEKILTEDTIMYRVHRDGAGKVGPYLSKTPQKGGLQSQLDLALNPSWGNTAENVTKVIVPKGTVIYEGVAAPQNIFDSLGNTIGTLPGGGNQIYIPKVEERWFK